VGEYKHKKMKTVNPEARFVVGSALKVESANNLSAYDIRNTEEERIIMISINSSARGTYRCHYSEFE
jgi:hypothetical protein